MADKSDNKLTRKDLLEGKKFGIHHVEEPIYGVKKIHCARYEKKWWKKNKEMVCSDGWAKVKIPAKAIVIRPWFLCDFCDWFQGHTSNTLRSDTVIFQSYKPEQEEACSAFFNNIKKEMMETYYCYSNDDNTSGYEWQKETRHNKFDQNVRDDRGGITFKLDKDYL